MTMIKTMEIRGDNAHETFTKARTACRGIVTENSLLLISHEVNADYFLIPGGGLEEGETVEECCVREIREETGFLVRPLFQFLTINEYYKEYKYISHYFLCEVTGKTGQELTPAEADRGLIPEWIAPEKLLELYARHQDPAGTNEEKRGAYLREYTALKEYFNIRKRENGGFGHG